MTDMIESKSFVDMVIDTYREGASDVEVCKAIKVSQKKFNEKYQSDANFAQLVDYGRMLSNAWWMEQARFAIRDKSFNTSMWAFVMKNRFGWADKTEAIQALPDAMADLDALKAKMEAMLPDIIKKINPSATDSQILKDLKIAK